MRVKIDFLIIIVLVLSPSLASLKCKNGARPILTRTTTPPYLLQYKCLCPFNYFGSDCNEYRQVLCYITKQNEVKYRPMLSETVHLSFEMLCYLKKLNFAEGKFLQTGETYQLPVNSSTIDNDEWENNHNIDPSLQIIWANKTSMFDDDGNLIRSKNDSRSDQQILDSYPKFTYEYTSEFFGVPYFDTTMMQNLTNVKYSNSSQLLGNIEVKFQKKSLSPLDKKIEGKFELKIERQWFEYQVALLSLQILQYYGDYSSLTHTSMNTAHWRVYDAEYTRGNTIGPTNSIPPWIWMFSATILIWGMLMTGKYVAQCRKEWRKSKNRAQDLVQERE